MSGTDRPLTLTGDGVSSLPPTHVANYRPAPVTSIEPFQKEAKMVLKVHHNHGQIRQPAAKQTFSLLRELKMAQIHGYNCALSVLGWPEQTPRDEKIITLGPRCAKFNHVQRCRIFTASFGIESTKSHQRVSAYDCIGVIPESWPFAFSHPEPGRCEKSGFQEARGVTIRH